jgi:NADH:ubiquinone oxidoreductase subunit 3 (subunit A)
MGNGCTAVAAETAMINVTLSQLVLLCFAIGLVMVTISWLLGSTRVRRAEKKRLKGVVTCRICGVRYEADEDKPSACPSCQTPNDPEPPNMI